jgi:hypothetical protein
MSLGEVAPLGFDRRPDGGDGVADVPAGTHGGDGDGASGPSPAPLGSGFRPAGNLARGSLDYLLWLWHVGHSSGVLSLLFRSLFRKE